MKAESTRILKNISEIENASAEELGRVLITPDGKGKAMKVAVLTELLLRFLAENK